MGPAFAGPFCMTQSYEESFRKIAPVEDLSDGQPKIFRAAGATVVLMRNGQALEAIDGSCVSDDADMSAAMRLTRILDCVAAGLGERDADWKSLVAKGGLAARIDDGWAWVCLDGCERDK
jgi:hypothetical protein